MLLRDYTARCAAHYPDRIAYHDNRDRALNWRQIHARSDRLAAALQQLGLEKGDVAAILSHEHLEVYEHLYACYKPACCAAVSTGAMRRARCCTSSATATRG